MWLFVGWMVLILPLNSSNSNFSLALGDSLFKYLNVHHAASHVYHLKKKKKKKKNFFKLNKMKIKKKNK